MVEALTQGLAGYGRADPMHTWGSSVFVQVFDPELFAGRADFTRQTGWLADACRATPPRDPVVKCARPVHRRSRACAGRKREASRRGGRRWRHWCPGQNDLASRLPTLELEAAAVNGGQRQPELHLAA